MTTTRRAPYDRAEYAASLLAFRVADGRIWWATKPNGKYPRYSPCASVSLTGGTDILFERWVWRDLREAVRRDARRKLREAR